LGDLREELVLDFFGGSGTAAEAVMQLNRDASTRHKFIVVQLPEPCNGAERSGKAALSLGLATLSAVARERIRRAEAQNESLNLPLEDRSTLQGFRAFALAESNLLVWDGASGAQPSEVEQQLALHVAHLRSGRTDDDLLFEILLKEGFALSTRSDVVTIASQKAQSLADGALIICLARSLDLDAIRAIANRGPQRVVCLDEGFAGNDQLKANAAQIFKAKGIVFRTV
jgi:adenine-specific DNA-methyltransferase